MSEIPELYQHWPHQCAAARENLPHFGLSSQIGYLIGEKFSRFVSDSQNDPLVAAQLSLFASEIRTIFTADEIRDYLNNVRLLGFMSHVFDDETANAMMDAGAIQRPDVERDIHIIATMRELLLS